MEIVWHGGREMSKAILVVSFGTSYHDTREKTIDAIENAIAQAYPEYTVYRAWTSGVIRAKLLKRDGIRINNVKEAMERMLLDGITDVVVQPTHVINGIENEIMKNDAGEYAQSFNSLSFGAPLLTSEDDNEQITRIIADNFSYLNRENEALVLMGHGTAHYSNSIYGALNFRFRDIGNPNIFLGTVESYPCVDSLIKAVKESRASRVTLAPFMVVAGDHANNDLAGCSKESWKSRFKAAGFEVDCVLKGLGEYPEVQKLFVSHVNDAMESVQQ